jgi:hypothetical protein
MRLKLALQAFILLIINDLMFYAHKALLAGIEGTKLHLIGVIGAPLALAKVGTP